MMRLAKFQEMVMKVENCWGLVVLYKVKGRGVCEFVIFLFLNTGDQSEIPPHGGLQNDMPRMQQRSKYKSYGALRGCDLGVRDCLQVYCGK